MSELKILDTPEVIELREPKKKRKRERDDTDKKKRLKKQVVKDKPDVTLAQIDKADPTKLDELELQIAVKKEEQFANDVTSNLLHLVSGFVDSLLGRVTRTVQHELHDSLSLF